MNQLSHAPDTAHFSLLSFALAVDGIDGVLGLETHDAAAHDGTRPVTADSHTEPKARIPPEPPDA